MSHLGVAAGGRCSHRASPKPSASVLLTQAPPVKLDHVSSFNEKPALVCGLTFEWHATLHVHVGRSQVKSLHALSGVQVPLIYPCASRCVCVCVMSLALSCHFTCHPAISLGSHLESEEGARRGARCHVQAWGGSITALAALHLTNGLLLSARDRPGALALTLAGCDTGPGVSRKHDTASTEPGRGGQETATEQPRPREHSGQLPLIPCEHTGLQTFAR